MHPTHRCIDANEPAESLTSRSASVFVCVPICQRYRKRIQREDDVSFSRGLLSSRTAAAAGALILSAALTLGAAQAQDKTFTMKITTPTLNAALDQYAKVLGAAVEKDSGGRI